MNTRFSAFTPALILLYFFAVLFVHCAGGSGARNGENNESATAAPDRPAYPESAPEAEPGDEQGEMMEPVTSDEKMPAEEAPGHAGEDDMSDLTGEGGSGGGGLAKLGSGVNRRGGGGGNAAGGDASLSGGHAELSIGGGPVESEESVVDLISENDLEVSDGPMDTSGKKLPEATVVFNVPPTMILNETKDIQLLLSEVLNSGELAELIEEDGEIEDGRVSVPESRLMTAYLEGSGFAVKAISPKTQIVESEGHTEWRWQITAVKPGTQKLFVYVHGVVRKHGEDRPLKVRKLKKEILIKVKMGQVIAGFVGEHWQWFCTAMIFPFAGWLWERRRRIQGKKKNV